LERPPPEETLPSEGGVGVQKRCGGKTNIRNNKRNSVSPSWLTKRKGFSSKEKGQADPGNRTDFERKGPATDRCKKRTKKKKPWSSDGQGDIGNDVRLRALQQYYGPGGEKG